MRHTHCLVSPIAVSLHDFESDVEALDDLLAWLAEGAVRIKALLADTAGGIGVAAETWAIPPGIMPPFPEKSNFGEVRGALLYLVEPRIAESLRYRLRGDENGLCPGSSLRFTQRVYWQSTALAVIPRALMANTALS